MAVRVDALIRPTLPIQYRAHNFAVKDDVLNALIASLGAFTNLLD